MPEENTRFIEDAMKGASGKLKAKRMVVLYEGGRPSRTWVGRCTKALGAECVAIKADSVRSLSSLPERKPAAVIFFDQAAADRFLAEVAISEVGSKEPKVRRSEELEMIKMLKNDFGISYETLSRILHVSHRTVLRWLHGECGPQPGHRDAIEKAVLLRNRMLKVLRKDAIPGYLRAYNEVLGGVRPLDLLTSGQADKVAADIASLEAGVFVQLPSSFSKILSSLPTKSYRGVVHRHIPEGGDAVASSFSRSAGGRWNPPGEFGALYTTTGEDDIEREMERAAEKRGITPKDLLPRDIVTIAVSLQKVLDLTDPAILLSLKFNVEDLTKDAYDDTCALARAVFRAGIEGILVPSAIGKGKNLVIYLENLSSKSSVSEKRRRKMQL